MIRSLSGNLVVDSNVGILLLLVLTTVAREDAAVNRHAMDIGPPELEAIAVSKED